MDFSLSSSLVGNAVSNPDKLALDLQFATDKTLTARKGPTPTFTRASTATFIGSDGLIQSAAINAARFDHDPITLACKGLLIEESRTNLITQSANISAWTGGFTNNGSTTAPDGTSSGYSAVIGFASCQSPITASVTGLHTASCFLKRNNTDWIRIRVIQGASVNVVTAWVNLATGVVGTVSATTGTPTSLSATITSYGNGWYRCSVTASYPATSYLYISLASATGDGIALGVAGSIYEVWGGQLEAGAFPTSYIPTTTASVVRSADICSITGANFTSFYNQSEGTVYTESRPATVNGTTTTFGLSNGTANERWLNRFAQAEQVVVTSAGTESTFDLLNPVAGTLYKTATAGKLNDFAMSINGLAVVTDTSQPMPNADRAGIGNATGAVAGGGAVTIASIRYYKKRLPNAKIVTLTA